MINYTKNTKDFMVPSTWGQVCILCDFWPDNPYSLYNRSTRGMTRMPHSRRMDVVWSHNRRSIFQLFQPVSSCYFSRVSHSFDLYRREVALISVFWVEGDLVVEGGTYGTSGHRTSKSFQVQSARKLEWVTSVLIQRYLRLHLVGLAMCSELYNRLVLQPFS